MTVIAANTLDAILYPHQRRLVVPIGEEQAERNGVLVEQHGIPGADVPRRDSPRRPRSAPLGVPVGLELLGPEWSEPTLLKFAYAFEQGARAQAAAECRRRCGEANIRIGWRSPRDSSAAGGPGTSASVSVVEPTAVAVAVDDVVVGPMLDPALWQTTVTVPDTAGKPARVAVREFERYYTDRTIPEQRGGPQQRRVVEERLVYTAFFTL